jgi:hypothetical protein
MNENGLPRQHTRPMMNRDENRGRASTAPDLETRQAGSSAIKIIK